ncbi:hypothetical protein P171DRAFT_447385 [Karstenula rhodostoma CBS 690.94]|uniref:Uncharacterized protein n=1 Tax=Karstenula rhodostoma CBS 690.94 TaxID=1392251 RepID=A0A9P4U7R7_9PLEO|nr:hypothetical protein P171DRAFT_447385 [Karstenula rhodostoma CBS 690.94]
MGQTSNRTTLKPDNSQLAQNAALAIRVALRSEWNRPGDAVSTVANEYICEKLNQAIWSVEGEQPDWEKYILGPLLDTCLAIYAAIDRDAKLVTQTVAVVLLAYDIIRQRNAVLTQPDRNFIENTFDRFLTSEALVAIREIVETETERCSGLDIDFGKLNALFVLESLLKEESLHRDEQQNGLLPEVIAAKALAESAKTPTTTSLASNGITSPPQPQTVSSHDIEIEYYINPGCALEFDCVVSIDVPNEDLVLETNKGYRVYVGEGVIVSKVEGKARTIEIRATTADGFERSATVIISPGNSYTIEDVTSVERVDETAYWTSFKTLKATIWARDGASCVYEHGGASVTIRNLLGS